MYSKLRILDMKLLAKDPMLLWFQARPGLSAQPLQEGYESIVPTAEEGYENSVPNEQGAVQSAEDEYENSVPNEQGVVQSAEEGYESIVPIEKGANVRDKTSDEGTVGESTGKDHIYQN